MRRLCGRSRFARFRPVGLVRLLVACGLVALSVVTGSAASAAPDRPAQADPPEVTVAKVSGPLDPVLADFVEQSIDQAEERSAAWVVLRMNSADTVVPDERVAELVERVRTADVQVGDLGRAVAGPGPGGRRAAAAVADEVSIGLRSRIGDFGDPVVVADRFTPAVPGGPRSPPRRHGRRRGRRGARPHRGAGAQHRRLPHRPRRGRDDRGRRPTPVPAAAPQGVGVPIAAARQPVHAHGGQPSGRLPALHLRHGPHRVRAVHRRGRRGRARGRRGLRARLLRPGRAAQPGRSRWACSCCRCSAFAIDVQTGVPRVWTGIGAGALVAGSLPALRRGVDLLDHAAGRDRRRAPVHARRHAGHGPHPVLDARRSGGTG